MDDALRQRLIGAAVIILLAVIFVPMLLDAPKEQTPAREQVDLTIPPRTDPGMETRRLPLDPDMSAPMPIPRSEEPDTSATDVAEQAPAAEPAPVAPATPAPAPVPTAPTPRPATPAVAESPRETTPAPAALPAPAPAVGGRFVAQFGSYADKKNADGLIADLAKVGVPASIEELKSGGGRTLYRVRSKGYATRTEADAARLSAQRQIAGLSSNVIELALANATQSVPAAAGRPSLSGWAVQVGVFSKAEAAKELSDKLRAAGYAAFVEPIKLAGGQTSHRVRIGPEARRDNAVKVQGEVKSKFKLDALVVAHP